MTEYWLQKKTLGGWQQVTWYNDVEQARKNYLQCVGNGLSGYCWRLVECETIEEALLNDVTEVKAPETDQGSGPLPKNMGWGVKSIKPEDVALVGEASPIALKSSGWGGTPSAWGKPIPIDPSPAVAINSDAPHGLSGSVWLIHHGKKHKTRVAYNLVDGMIAEGYVRGSPRMQFREG